MRGVTADEAMLLAIKARGGDGPRSDFDSPLGLVYRQLRAHGRFIGRVTELGLFNEITPLGRLALELYNSGIAR